MPATPCSATLVLLCKRPKLHQGKQRLAKDIGPEQTLIFAEHFLHCAIEDLSQWPASVVISPAHKADVEWAKALWLSSKPHQSSKNPNQNPEVIILPQEEGNLGQRLNSLDTQLRAEGHHSLIFMGSDAPILSASHFTDAQEKLLNNDIVLSKAKDGGVILMANNQPWPNMDSLPWSSEKLARALQSLCEQNHLSVGFAKAGYDVDDSNGLTLLAQDLAGSQGKARQALLKEVQKFTANSFSR